MLEAVKTIEGKLVDYFPDSKELLIEATDGGKVLLPVHLLPENQQHGRAKRGQPISLRGRTVDQKIVMVEGEATFHLA